MPAVDREAQPRQPAADRAGTQPMDQGGFAEGLEGVAFGGQEEAMQEDGQGEAGPDADAFGIGEETLVEPLYGGGNRTNNHKTGTCGATEIRLAADFFIPPGAFSLNPSKSAMVLIARHCNAMQPGRGACNACNVQCVLVRRRSPRRPPEERDQGYRR